MDKEEFNQAVIDDLLIYGTSVVHVDSQGNKNVVNPMEFFTEELNDAHLS